MTRELFYHKAPTELAEAALVWLRPQPEAPSQAPLLVTAERFGRLTRAYIECSEDRMIPIDTQHRMQRLHPCEPVMTLASDHSPFLFMPDNLARAIDGIARGFTAMAPVMETIGQRPEPGVAD